MSKRKFGIVCLAIGAVLAVLMFLPFVFVTHPGDCGFSTMWLCGDVITRANYAPIQLIAMLLLPNFALREHTATAIAFIVVAWVAVAMVVVGIVFLVRGGRRSVHKNVQA